MRRWHLITSLILAAATPAARAHTPKEGDIWATIGPYFYRTQTSLDTAGETPYIGGGISTEADVDYNGGVEISMVYVDKLYVRHKDGDLMAESIKRMHITTGYRHWFWPWLSMGLGYYSAYSMGDPKVVRDERPSGKELLTSAHAITEYGADTSLQWEIYGDDRFGLVLDTRYSFSTSRKSKEAANHYGALLSFKYLVPKN